MPALLFQPHASASQPAVILKSANEMCPAIWGYGSKMIIPPSGGFGDSEQGNAPADWRFWGRMS